MNLEDIELRELRPTDRKEFLDAVSTAWEPNFITAHYFEEVCGKNFDQYISLLSDVKKGNNIPFNHVPSTTLFGFYQNKIIIRFSIRHTLDEFLSNIGGHVGYVVDPSYRKKGVASYCLGKCIEYIKQELPDIPKLLITCDESNIASEKVILRQNAIFDSYSEPQPNGIRKKRFWINIKETQ
jgi:predicted acetyltransferase